MKPGTKARQPEPGDTAGGPAMVRPSMAMSGGLLDARILRPLARLRRRGRIYVALDGAARLLLTLILTGLTQLLIDRWLRLSSDQRAVLNIVLTAIWLWVIYRYLITPILAPAPDRALARAVDRRHPALQDRLGAAVEFAEGRVGDAASNSPQLVAAVIEEACQAATRVSFLDVLNHRWARRRGIEMGGLALLIGLAFVLLPDTMGTWFRRNWLMHDIPWPQNTYITPVGFDANNRRRMPRGDEFDLVAQIRGEAPGSAVLEWRSADGRSGREAMTLIGQTRAEVSLGVLSSAVRFRIVGGDERTSEYTVDLIDRPDVARTMARVTPPAYTGLPPVELEHQTVIELLDGSTLELEAQLNKPVRTANFIGASGVAAACELPRPDLARVSWNEPKSGAYWFELVDADGWTNRHAVRYTFKVAPDAPPTVKLNLSEVGDCVTPQADPPLELVCGDAYGLGEVELLAQRDEDPPISVALSGFERGRREFRVQMRLPLSALSAGPGQRIRLWARAADIDPRGPNVARTEPVDLRVLAPADFLAEMAGREQELRQEFERLISEQSGLKDALDRIVPTLPEAGDMPAVPAQRLAGLARRQDTHAARVLTLRRAFAEILAEMRTSKVARSADERRIGQRIETPLEQIGGESMPGASAAITALRRIADKAAAARLPGSQIEILRQMRAVLANMLELEGYREAVALLQQIIDDQTQVRSATVEALSRQVDAIIGLDEPAPNPPPPEPSP